MNKKFKLLLALGALSTLFGCEKVLMEDQNTAPTAIFEEAWEFVDHTYSFFEIKNINWDSLHAEYAVGITDDMEQKALFDSIASMLYHLNDGHVNLSSDFNRSRNWQWYLDAPDNFDYDLLERYYFKEQQAFMGPFIVMPFDSIGYIRYASFGSSFSNTNLALAIAELADTKGLIIDVRDNTGGSLGRARQLASPFIDKTTTVGAERFKNGPEHNDFTNWQTVQQEPFEIKYYAKPVVILTNAKCYSACSYFIEFMRHLNHVTLIGSRTGGGMGIPSFTELPNGWILRVSSTQFKTLDEQEAEMGIEPDIEVNLTTDDLLNNRDGILEYALDYLR